MKREYKKLEWLEYSFAEDVVTASGVADTGTEDDQLTDTIPDDFDVL